MKSLTIIAGANRSSKTAFALECCREFGLDFINFDQTASMPLKTMSPCIASHFSYAEYDIIVENIF